MVFDVYFLESSLYATGKWTPWLVTLRARGQTYEDEGALWLRTTAYGDDKDRVMRKSDGTFTYFVPDVAYHVTKWERGFRRAINVQGADHHSTVTRVRAGLQALGMGVPPDYPEYVLHQMVTVMKGGEEVKISKRAGSYVTVRELIDDVGIDAVRYFFLMRKGDSQLIFDVDLAREQTEKNPVFYVQMAHARLSGIFRTADRSPETVTGRSRPGRAPGAAGHRAPQEAGCFPRGCGGRGARARAAPDRPRISTIWPPLCTAGITTPAPSEPPKVLPPSRPGCCWPGPREPSWPMRLGLLGISAPDRM